MSEEDSDNPLKEILRLGKFLAQICKAIGHDYAEGEDCCQRCGAQGTKCKKREHEISELRAQLQSAHAAIQDLKRRLENYERDYYRKAERGYYPGPQWTSESENERMRKIFETEMKIKASPKIDFDPFK